MKTKIKFITAAILMLLFVSCAEDIVNDKTKISEEEGTVFVGGKFNTNAPAKSRSGMAMDTITNEIEFLWSSGDKIYLADGTASEQWNKKDDHFAVAETADFVFRGKAFTEPSYDIYFPGKKGTIYNKVNIPIEAERYVYYDTENVPNTINFMYDNDCGFAKAIRQPDGKYYFNLEHQSAFIIYCPYSQNKVLGSQIVTRGATITADTNITGEYTITPNGLTGTGSSMVAKTPAESFSLSDFHYTPGTHAFDGSVKNRGFWNSYILQIAPAKTKLKLEEEYFITAYSPTFYGWLQANTYLKNTRTKNIPLHDYKKNTFTTINSLIAFPYYKPEYYVWDSEKDKEIVSLFKDDERLKDNRNNDNWIGSYDGITIPNVTTFSNPSTTTATRSMKDCPNKVEAAWYIAHGDPHWDPNYLWTNGHKIYMGAVWFLKKKEISGFNSTTLPADVTFTGNSYKKSSIKKGTPTDTTKYFVLPFQGRWRSFSGDSYYMDIAQGGYYWTRDAYDANNAWRIFLNGSTIFMDIDEKKRNAFPLWTVQ